MTHTPPKAPLWIAGICEIATRHPAVAEEIVRAASRVGLSTRSLEIERGSASEAPLVSGVREVLGAVGVDAAIHEVEAGPFDASRLERALSDPGVDALVLRGDPSWSLRLPLARGAVAGFMDDDHVDSGSRSFCELVAAIFDGHLCEWGLVGPETTLRGALSGVKPGELVDANPLPAAGVVTYLSPDLAYETDLAAVSAAPGIRRLRSRLGGMVLGTSSDPAIRGAATGALPAALSGARDARARPPVHVYALPNTRLLLRDVSPGLGAWQAQSAAACAEWAGVPAAWTIDVLRELDTALAIRLSSVGAPILEGWSAFAGEVARRLAGGRWRRIMDVWTPFPNNLVVELPSGVPLQAHSRLIERINGGDPRLAPIVEELLRR